MKHRNKFYSLLIAFLAFALGASADNKLTIEDFSIVPGQTKDVSVLLENEDLISSIQFDLTLPEGLYVNRVTKNADRLKNHQVGSPTLSNGDLRVVVLTTATDLSKTAFVGNEGAILTISFYASLDYKGGAAEIHDIEASDATVPEPIERLIPGTAFKASVDAGIFTVSAADDINEKLTQGETAQVDLFIENTTNFAGLQVDVKLPENLEVVDILTGERVPDSYEPSPNQIEAGGSSTVVLSALFVENIEGTEGLVLSFLVKATDVVEGDIVINHALATDKTGDGYFLLSGEGVIPVKANPNTYAIAIAEGIENGSVAADVEEATEGKTVTLTITPAAGFELGAVSVFWTDEEGVEQPVEVAEDFTFVVPRADVTVSATFVAVEYQVSVAEGIANGTVSADAAQAKAGDTVTLTITPAQGYELESVSVAYTDEAGEAQSVELAADYTFVMPTANVTIATTFKLSTEVSVSSAVVDGTAKANGRKYMENGKVTIYSGGKKYSVSGIEQK